MGRIEIIIDEKGRLKYKHHKIKIIFVDFQKEIDKKVEQIIYSMGLV